MDINTFVTATLLWIAGVTGYADSGTPTIVYRTPQELMVIYYRPQTLADLKGKVPVVALHRRGTIFLSEGFIIANPEDQSTLVQELTHYLQFNAGMMDSRCRGKNEFEAYQVENRWRGKHHLALIDQRFIRLLSGITCPPTRHRNRMLYHTRHRRHHR